VVRPTSATARDALGSRPAANTIATAGSGFTTEEHALMEPDDAVPSPWPNVGSDYTYSWQGTKAASGTYISWICWGLGDFYTLQGLHVWNVNNVTARGLKDVDVKISNDATAPADWSAIPVAHSLTFAKASGSSAYTGEDQAFSSLVTARWVYFGIKNNHGDTYVGLDEIRFIKGETSVEADTFTWTQLSGGNASGSWGGDTNWNAGIGPVANGQDHTANFGTLDISANSTVMIDGSQTIGNLVFGDAATATAASWFVNTGTPSDGALTLEVSSGKPTITVNTLGTGAGTTINAALAGSSGLAKSGAGTLTLSGNNSNLTGGITLSQGTLKTLATSAVGNNAFTLGGGTLELFNTTYNYGSDVIVTGSTTLGFAVGVTYAYTVTLGKLSISNQTLTATSSSLYENGNAVFAGLTTLSGNATFSIASGESSRTETGPTLTFADVTVDPGVAGGNTTTVSFTRGNSYIYRERIFRVTGVMSDAAPDRKLGVRVLGVVGATKATVQLRGANTFTGPTRITAGELILYNNGSLATANILIDGGKLTGSATTQGTLNYPIDGATANTVSITGAGILDLTNLKLNVSVAGPAEGEYVIADKAVGSANVLGTQFYSVSVNGATGWSIDYDGTAEHPGAIVLILPSPGAIILFN
jgi:autotransporter-associated beta strand protein